MSEEVQEEIIVYPIAMTKRPIKKQQGHIFLRNTGKWKMKDREQSM